VGKVIDAIIAAIPAQPLSGDNFWSIGFNNIFFQGFSDRILSYIFETISSYWVNCLEREFC
jgi:hypothetical protein